MLWGGLNTAVTYVFYLRLASLMHFQLAYLFSYLAGIAFAYFLNLRLVFAARSSRRKALLYPFIYFAQYVLGAALMQLLVGVLELSSTLAPLLVVIILLPATYYLNKKLLTD